MSPTPKVNDARVLRTRAALIAAFNRTLLSRGYDAIRPGTIAADAGVVRSTFYEHFDGKASLLREAVSPVLEPLARSVRSKKADPALVPMVEHFWHNRALARVLLTGRPRIVVHARLAALIDDALRTHGCEPLIARPLVAAHIAHGQLGLIEHWLAAKDRCGASALASALHRSTVAQTSALLPVTRFR